MYKLAPIFAMELNARKARGVAHFGKEGGNHSIGRQGPRTSREEKREERKSKLPRRFRALRQLVGGQR